MMMTDGLDLGQFQTLVVDVLTEFGAFLGKGNKRVLLPNRYVPEGLQPGMEIEVFVYIDASGKPLATTLKPFALAGETALLTVKSEVPFGWFVDLGLDKDVLVPRKEITHPVAVGEKSLFHIYVDHLSKRLVASQRIERFTRRDRLDLEIGQSVSVVVREETPIGFTCLVEGRWLGMLYKNEIFTSVLPGNVLHAFVHRVREDGKVDLRLQRSAGEETDPAADTVLEKLAEAKGFLAISDQTAPEEIYRVLGISKKLFKKAIGRLYKQRKILLEQGGIRLVS
jgi:predicted RNA-binding protein (virulence factor B family)